MGLGLGLGWGLGLGMWLGLGVRGVVTAEVRVGARATERLLSMVKAGAMFRLLCYGLSR